MVVIDATILMLFLRPEAGIPTGAGRTPIEKPIERINFLIKELEKARTKIIVPTPVLSEVLVRVKPAEAHAIVEKIAELSVFRIEPFEARAAIELAAMTRNSIDGGNKPQKRDPAATWAKLKFDRQIVAIAKVAQAKVIYSNDGDIRKIAGRENIKVIGLADLQLPAEDAQIPFKFPERAGSDGKQIESGDPTAAKERDERGAVQALPHDGDRDRGGQGIEPGG